MAFRKFFDFTITFTISPLTTINNNFLAALARMLFMTARFAFVIFRHLLLPSSFLPSFLANQKPAVNSDASVKYKLIFRFGCRVFSQPKRAEPKYLRAQCATLILF